MTVAPVGIRCPDHAGAARQRRSGGSGLSRSSKGPVVQPARFKYTAPVVTTVLIGLNVAIYLAELIGGGTINGVNNWIYDHGSLVIRAGYSDGTPAGLDAGEWWRLLTAAFLHYGPIHLGINMLALWWLGGPVRGPSGTGAFSSLHRLGARGLSRRARRDAQRHHRGCLRRNLRHARRRPDTRVQGDRATRRQLSNADHRQPRLHVRPVLEHLGGWAHRRPDRGNPLHPRDHPVRQVRAGFQRAGGRSTGLLLAVGVGSVLVAYWRVRGLA